ncbi:hypothetical protein CP533_5642 [Ophiocordyceps camponoti-saundersi (nom. inval.)]|nr:hypothetical protein CP533_5642 [Ophiocordyceps camponoti-saundersi (nom. inval.)]
MHFTHLLGFVKFPPKTMITIPQPNQMNYFYWYFPAQEKPEESPVVVWLNGGPGATGMTGVFTENGPCRIDKDLKQKPNPDSWNKKYNMLYIDQPIHVGYSHDVPTKGIVDLVDGDILPNATPEKLGLEDELSFLPGTFSSQDPASTANTTLTAARHFWNFMQVFSKDFLKDHPSDGTLSIWAESIGGHYSPVFARFIQDQNIRISKGKLPDSKPIKLSTVGIMNGCVDTETEGLSKADFAFNTNTYGIQQISEAERDKAHALFEEKDGCRDLLRQCEALGAAQDIAYEGKNKEVNKACSKAEKVCFESTWGAYFNQTIQRSTFDITQCGFGGDPFSEPFQEYLNQTKIIEALQVPVSLTAFSNACFKGFQKTGDGARGHMRAIASLLDIGIPVAMVYGDRDWICNWKGGEQISKAINHTQADLFSQSGYTNVEDDGKTVGQVRQQGLLSYTRVFQASHFVSYTQPKASFTIFDRAMQGKDIATGKITIDGDFTSQGSAESTASSEKPAVTPPVCHLLALRATCSEGQIKAVEDNSAKIENGIITSPGIESGACPA